MTLAPDSRLRNRLKGVVRGLFCGESVNLVPIFCASCHKSAGYVPERSVTFAFWLCDPCSERYGEQAGLLKIPDQVFWDKLREEQLERHGRLLTTEELRVASESPCTALGKLIREGN